MHCDNWSTTSDKAGPGLHWSVVFAFNLPITSLVELGQLSVCVYVFVCVQARRQMVFLCPDCVCVFRACVLTVYVCDLCLCFVWLLKDMTLDGDWPITFVVMDNEMVADAV